MKPDQAQSRDMPTASPGLFVISLDFELYWGMRHNRSVKSYMSHLVGARQAIPALLRLFAEYSIHATWATVGFLFFDHVRELLEYAPRQRPQYRNRMLYPYSDLPPEDVHETPESVFFAPSLIRLIAAEPNQEVATHTFSHYFCLEEGQHLDTFRDDILAARNAGQRMGLDLRSLVFPQNEFKEEYIGPCLEAGIVAYRGNQPSWIYRETAQEQQGPVRRVGRLLDSYVPVSSGNCSSVPSTQTGQPVNVPASRFLRPYSHCLRAFESVRLRRITREMSMAAERGLLYHLWWHPHNFGCNTEYNFAFLRRILDHYRALNEQHGFESATMGEVADSCLTHRLCSRDLRGQGATETLSARPSPEFQS